MTEYKVEIACMIEVEAKTEEQARQKALHELRKSLPEATRNFIVGVKKVD